MKKFGTLMALVLSLSLLASCASTGNIPSVTTAGTEPSTTPTSLAPSATDNAETTKENTEDQILTNQVPKTLKVLAIGNSFSTDGMQYLYDIAKSAGVEEIILGNLYIGGCSLATHLSNAKSNSPAYTYYKNTKGTWIANNNKTLLDGLTDEKWDYISMQQSSPNSGLPSTYGKTLTQLIDYVKENKTNPDAKLIWHMTWAYQSDSTHSGFANYNKDQMKMYQAIIDTVKSSVLPTSEYELVIPTGTSIQNARTSFIGDKITRDGYHLNYNLGRYIAGLTWYAAITGASIDDIAYNPAPSEINDTVMAMAKDSVKNAIKNPYEITESTYKTGEWKPAAVRNSDPVVPADCFEADLALAATIGIDLSKYVLLEYKYLKNSYYNSPNGSKVTTPGSSASTYKQNICSAKIYTKAEIPENTVIICDTGWQFRPEFWVSLDKGATTRRDMITANITLMDAQFWGNNNYFAFNIASYPKADISEYYDSAATHVRIYIPIN